MTWRTRMKSYTGPDLPGAPGSMTAFDSFLTLETLDPCPACRISSDYFWIDPLRANPRHVTASPRHHAKAPNRGFLPTRQSLLSRLKNADDSQSWQDFFDSYWKLIYGVAMKSGLTEVEAQEVVQETVIAVSRKMPEFRYDPSVGSFKAWLLNQTRWRIQDQFRKRRRDAKAAPPPGLDEEPGQFIESIPDPATQHLDRVWEEEWRQHVLDTVLARIKPRVSARQYQIFDLYVNKQWPVQKIQKTLKVTSTQVYLAKHRITAMIREEVQNMDSSYR